MIQIPELGIEVEDVDDFNEEASTILSDFTMELWDEWGNRMLVEHNEEMVEAFNVKASNEIDAKHAELYSIGRKYFNENELDIENDNLIYLE